MTRGPAQEWHKFVTIPCGPLRDGRAWFHHPEKSAHEQPRPPWNVLGELPSPSKRVRWANGVARKGADRQTITNRRGTLYDNVRHGSPQPSSVLFDLHPDICYVPSSDRKTCQVVGRAPLFKHFWAGILIHPPPPAFQALFGVRFPIPFLSPPVCTLEFLLTRETRVTHTNSASLSSYQTGINLEGGDFLILLCNLPAPQNPYVKVWWGVPVP